MAGGELPVAVTISPDGSVPAKSGGLLIVSAKFTITGTNDGDPTPWTNDLQWYSRAEGDDAWTEEQALEEDVLDTSTYFLSFTPPHTGRFYAKATVIHTDPNTSEVTTFDSDILRIYSVSHTEKVLATAVDPVTGLNKMSMDTGGA